MRTAEIIRNTSETQIKLTLNLDGTGRCDVKNPLGFLITFCVPSVNTECSILQVNLRATFM